MAILELPNAQLKKIKRFINDIDLKKDFDFLKIDDNIYEDYYKYFKIKSYQAFYDMIKDRCKLNNKSLTESIEMLKKVKITAEKITNDLEAICFAQLILGIDIVNTISLNAFIAAAIDTHIVIREKIANKDV